MLTTLLTTTIAQLQRRTEQVTISPIANDPGAILNNAYNAFLLIIGVVAVLAIVVGGYQIIMSQGEPANIEKGKKTITAAIVGLLIVVIAQIILRSTVNCAASLFVCIP